MIGHGIGLRRQHFAHVLEHGASGVDWLEVITEDYFPAGGRPWAVLERARRDVPVVLHGVGLGLGSTDPLSEDYLRDLQRVIARVEPAWVSDHLAWGSIDGRYSHELLPVPRTEESLAHVADRVAAVQSRLGRRLLLENPSVYAGFREDAIDEPSFLNELARRTGCGVLLDVNNVVVSGRNLGFDPVRYVDAIDRGIVGQIHVAGHTVYEDHVLDSHVGPVPEAVWALYERAIARFGEVPTLVEWDTDVPSFERVARERAEAAARCRRVLGPRDEARA